MIYFILNGDMMIERATTLTGDLQTQPFRIWIVWEYKRDIRPGSGNAIGIRAICAKEELAEMYQRGLESMEKLKDGNSEFHIEPTITNHLYGWDEYKAIKTDRFEQKG